ncbi:uncharacterized protein EI97DRAFT_43060 [Westerdykella ornata]|uniref:DUF676 domain-containing protein n=1 Tax=Westerdykella ornata TaxID=318751 RepID=A0A6A6JJW5_WESOR|nr:uncharacterized protein EI97DRAFT_43060 [Westerdykella ornata]KAF2276525.1 hypothetical protein EI97DRAFT_43060 [Westerdykella ornata]
MAETGMEILWQGKPPITADVVFVHGLRGDRIRTWEKGTVVWPRDLLKDAIPNARIMTWGYDADTMHFMSAVGQSSIAALAEQLLDDLADKRKPKEARERPIVFVTHSLGGLIVKDALWQSYVHGRTEHVYFPRKAAIKKHTAGIVFAGTPHRGSDQAKWPLVATNLATKVFKDNNPKLIQALIRGSETLERLQNDFSKIALQLPIQTYTEDKNLAVNQKVVENDSAILGFPNEARGILPGNHIGMVKLGSSTDTGYERMSNCIANLIEDVLESQQQEGL